jgi:hypothetical protein
VPNFFLFGHGVPKIGHGVPNWARSRPTTVLVTSAKVRVAAVFEVAEADWETFQGSRSYCLMSRVCE